MDDLTAQVSQQATLMLGTIHDAALRSVISCLEYQFDTGEFLSMTIFCSNLSFYGSKMSLDYYQIILVV